MKKVSVFLLLFVFSSIITNAQNKTGGGGFRIGGKVGANLNKISGQSFNDGFEYAIPKPVMCITSLEFKNRLEIVEIKFG
jgi:hypothetical protein